MLIGSRILRIEDEPFLRGKGRYIDDVTVPGLLHAAFARSAREEAARAGPKIQLVVALLLVPSVLLLVAAALLAALVDDGGAGGSLLGV